MFLLVEDRERVSWTLQTLYYIFTRILKVELIVNGKCIQTFWEEMCSDEIVDFAYVR